MKSSIPITDNHIHIDPLSGLGPVEVGKLFSRSGGTHMIVVNKMVEDYGFAFRSIDDFRRATEFFLRSVEEIDTRTTVSAFPVVGPHPVELVRLWDVVGPDVGVSLMEEALNYSAEMVREGRAIAIGEVGRPHFQVPDLILEASNNLLDLALQLAGDVGCAVQLHMETSAPDQYEELATRAKSAGLVSEKVVKHHSPPLVSSGLKTGIFPSILARRRNVEEALAQGDRFLLETDYIDDAERPGAVLGPRTVPKVTRSLMDEGRLSETSAHRIHKLNVEKIYGIDISL